MTSHLKLQVLKGPTEMLNGRESAWESSRAMDLGLKGRNLLVPFQAPLKVTLKALKHHWVALVPL